MKQSLPPSALSRCCILLLLVMGYAPVSFGFGFSDVAKKAEALAAQPHAALPTIPKALADLSYDQYRRIRFRPEDRLWSKSHTRFQVMLMPAGSVYHHPVAINVVDANGVHPVAFQKSAFHWPSEKLRSQVPDDLGYAGFKLTFPLNSPDVQNRFLEFGGNTYFRGVGRNQRFGLSARGIALDTGLASGEEFPDFTRYWLVRPSPDAHAMKFYALLQGKSMTGAYRFVVFPGQPTRVEVHARLFVRQGIKMIGFAPLTSMFFYGANTVRPQGDWRPAVHDSGGLLIHSGTGEWLWRPLINPKTLQMYYFRANFPRGFGLLQRTTRFSAYEDAKARYGQRPSAWVEPRGDWGKGNVVLVQIPSDSETNDNVVAFWSPSGNVKMGTQYTLDYTLSFGRPGVANEPMARAVKTFVGSAAPPSGKKEKHAYRFVVDFSGGPLDNLSNRDNVRAIVSGLGNTRVLKHAVRRIDANGDWRLSVLASSDHDDAVKLRAFLKNGKKTLSETWTYNLPAKNAINGD